MEKKRIAIIAAAACVGAVAIVGSILAYLSDKDDATNKIEVAENKIKIVEEFPDPDVQNGGSNVYIKEVAVKNTGNTDTYVRVYLDFANSEMAGRSFLSLDGTTYYPYISGETAPTVDGLTFETALYPSAIESLTKSDATDTNYWVYNSADGFYYYTGKVAVGDETERLLKNVLIYNNSVPIRDVDIYIYAESVQTVNSAGAAYASYTAAWADYTSE